MIPNVSEIASDPTLRAETQDAQLPLSGNGDRITAGETIDWLAAPLGQSLRLQRLSQSDGYETRSESQAP